jgi:hypothetical protein
MMKKLLATCLTSVMLVSVTSVNAATSKTLKTNKWVTMETGKRYRLNVSKTSYFSMGCKNPTNGIGTLTLYKNGKKEKTTYGHKIYLLKKGTYLVTYSFESNSGQAKVAKNRVKTRLIATNKVPVMKQSKTYKDRTEGKTALLYKLKVKKFSAIKITLKGHKKRDLAFYNIKTKDNHFMSYLAKGTYLVSVEPHYAHTYSLNIKETACKQSFKGDDSTYKKAHTVKLNKTYYGYLTSGEKADYYRFKAPYTGHLTIQASKYLTGYVFDSLYDLKAPHYNHSFSDMETFTVTKNQTIYLRAEPSGESVYAYHFKLSLN